MFQKSCNHSLLLPLIATLLTPFQAQSQQPADSKSASPKKICYWVFLNRGKGRENFKGINKEALAQMQASHIANLTKLNREGKALTAGPLGEDGTTRGIVVLNLDESEKAQDCFAEDPYVQNDLLKVESYRCLMDVSKFRKPSPKFRIGEFTLGILKRGAKTGSKSGFQGKLPELKSVALAGDLAISGELVDARDKAGVMLFRSVDRAKIQNAAQREPEIRSGKYVLELHSQWLDPTVLSR